MEFRVLGPLGIRERGSWIELGAKQQALLAVLLVQANRVVKQDQLIEALWPGFVLATAKANLHSLTYRLRRTLTPPGKMRPEVLSWSSQGYVLRVPPTAVDMYRFERLVADGHHALENRDYATTSEQLGEALDMWRGEAFAGVDVSVVRERANALERTRLDATEWRLTAELRLGRHQQVLRDLEQLTVEQPYREGLWELLMLALHQTGRQADALAAYRRLYRLLDEDLGIEPRRSVQELHHRILSGAADDNHVPVASIQAEGTAPKQPPTVPRSLPLNIRDFVGRSEELKALDALLPDATESALSFPVVCAITGPAGIGKSALAVHWAHRVAEWFPDGQLHLNLRGFDPSGRAVRWSEAIRSLLETLGVESNRIPMEPEAQAALFRSLLAGKRMLVLLDNAADEDQVRPLLPGSAGCLILVTSRRRLPGLVAAEAAHPLVLRPLSTREARELLVQRLGADVVTAEPAAVHAIIDRCGGLPLALAVVAARAVTRPELPLSAQAGQLCHPQANLDSFGGSDSATNLRAVFSWSYDALSTDSARLFRLLGLHPGPDITVLAAASLAAESPDRIRALLDELTEAQLLAEHQVGRYVPHDLLHAYARELAHGQDTETERRTATVRLVSHYADTAYAAATLIDRHRCTTAPRRSIVELGSGDPEVPIEQFADEEQALTWFDTERHVLAAIVSLAASDHLDIQVRDLAWALSDFYQRRALWHDKEVNGRLGLDAARRLDDKEAQVWAHLDLGKVYGMTGRPDDAETHLTRALAIATESGLVGLQGGALQNLGLALSARGRHADALEHELRALDLFRTARWRRAEAGALNTVGWRLAQLGEYQNALAYCQQGLTVQQEIGDRYTESDTWDSLGYIHHQLGDYRRAAECYRRSLTQLGPLGRRFRQAETLANLGDTLVAVGEFRNGRHHWQQALTILDELGHPDADRVRAKLSSEQRSESWSGQR